MKEEETAEEVAFRKLEWRIEHDKNNYMSQMFGCWLFQMSSVLLIFNSERDQLLDISMSDEV